MMEIKERLALSARRGKLTLIREGMFMVRKLNHCFKNILAMNIET